jgi:hypothetical protein
MVHDMLWIRFANSVIAMVFNSSLSLIRRALDLATTCKQMLRSQLLSPTPCSTQGVQFADCRPEVPRSSESANIRFSGDLINIENLCLEKTEHLFARESFVM